MEALKAQLQGMAKLWMCTNFFPGLLHGTLGLCLRTFPQSLDVVLSFMIDLRIVMYNVMLYNVLIIDWARRVPSLDVHSPLAEVAHYEHR
jgi:hypothetical protein